MARKLFWNQPTELGINGFTWIDLGHVHDVHAGNRMLPIQEEQLTDEHCLRLQGKAHAFPDFPLPLIYKLHPN